MDKIKLRNTCIIILSFIILLAIWGIRENHYLGRGFTYFEDPSFVSYWRFGDTIHFNIPPDILSYKNTWNTLLIKQKPRHFEHTDDTHYEYYQGRDSVYYFFVDKKNKEVIGPLLYPEMEAFLQERDFVSLLNKLD